jgi:hypothetical protein
MKRDKDDILRAKRKVAWERYVRMTLSKIQHKAKAFGIKFSFVTMEDARYVSTSIIHQDNVRVTRVLDLTMDYGTQGRTMHLLELLDDSVGVTGMLKRNREVIRANEEA